MQKISLFVLLLLASALSAAPVPVVRQRAAFPVGVWIGGKWDGSPWLVRFEPGGRYAASFEGGSYVGYWECWNRSGRHRTLYISERRDGERSFQHLIITMYSSTGKTAGGTEISLKERQP